MATKGHPDVEEIGSQVADPTYVDWAGPAYMFYIIRLGPRHETCPPRLRRILTFGLEHPVRDVRKPRF
jgi:hypothetical protein